MAHTHQIIFIVFVGPFGDERRIRWILMTNLLIPMQFLKVFFATANWLLRTKICFGSEQSNKIFSYAAESLQIETRQLHDCALTLFWANPKP